MAPIRCVAPAAPASRVAITTSNSIGSNLCWPPSAPLATGPAKQTSYCPGARLNRKPPCASVRAEATVRPACIAATGKSARLVAAGAPCAKAGSATDRASPARQIAPHTFVILRPPSCCRIPASQAGSRDRAGAGIPYSWGSTLALQRPDDRPEDVSGLSVAGRGWGLGVLYQSED